MQRKRRRRELTRANRQAALRQLADDLAGAGWVSKPEPEWTPAERAAYERWAEQQPVPENLMFQVFTSAEEASAEEHRVGAFVRPLRFTLDIDRRSRTFNDEVEIDGS